MNKKLDNSKTAFELDPTYARSCRWNTAYDYFVDIEDLKVKVVLDEGEE